jgi:hypothetical protein
MVDRDKVKFPNFLVLGPPRTGTTWLYRCLREHPKVFLPEIKQLHFFDRHFGKGIEWYKKFFAGVRKEHEAIGEITPDYLSNEEACKRIRAACKDMKFVIVYRDPVERAFSQYKVRKRSSEYGYTGSLSEMLREDSTLVKDSLYGSNVKRCIELFGDREIYIANFDHMRMNPYNYLKSILTFLLETELLEVEPIVIERRYGASFFQARFQSFDALLRRTRQYLESTRYGRRFADWLRDQGVVSKIHDLNVNSRHNTLSKPEYNKCRSFFLRDSEKFLELIDNCEVVLDFETRKSVQSFRFS